MSVSVCVDFLPFFLDIISIAGEGGRKDGKKEGRKGGWMDGWKKGRVDGWMGGRREVKKDGASC